MKGSRSRTFARALRRYQPQTDAQVAGSRARKAGRSLEDALNEVNAWYERRGEAVIEKVNLPTEGWGRTLRIAGDSTVDYTGTYRQRFRDGFLASPQGIAFDAKSWAGKAKFGANELPKGKDALAHRTRFLRQVSYLKNLRDRHSYVAFFLLYCSELDTVWLCGDLDALARGESVPVRDKLRPSKKLGLAGGVVHHLPHLVGRTGPNALSLPALAATPRLDTGRPHLDYLSLLK